MNALQMIKARLQNIPIKDMLEEAAREYTPVIEDLNAEQLLQGTYTTGREITPGYRNPVYAQAKQFMNSRPRPGVPDLKATGAYHESIEARVDTEGISMEATDAKAQDLEAKYGDELIGLSDASRETLAHDYLKPSLVEQVLKYLAGWRQ